MREIKFRAWNSDQMHTVEEWTPSWVAIPVQVGEDEWQLEQLKLPETPLMQFTGLKDKNGKEIYEGDVLKRYGVHEPIYVYWKAPCFVATGAAGVGHWYFDEAGAVEVIGNIYENPELVCAQPRDGENEPVRIA